MTQVMKEFKSGCVFEDTFFKEDIEAVKKALVLDGISLMT